MFARKVMCDKGGVGAEGENLDIFSPLLKSFVLSARGEGDSDRKDDFPALINNLCGKV
jgi:hypothetical protein